MSTLLYVSARRKFRRPDSRRQSALALALAIVAVTPAAGEEGSADLVLRNGRVVTMDAARSQTTAVAVRGGRILWVGFEDGIAAHVDAGTDIVDLDGRLVLPGFQDAHTHPISGGLEALGCDLYDATSLDEVRERIARCAAEAADSAWVVGSGWHLTLFGDGYPHRRLLDELLPERPVYLADSFEHTAWVNSRALELAGITAATGDPAGGRIERDEDGTPSGVLQETAMNLVARLVPPPTDAELLAGARYAVAMAHRFGITGVFEARCDRGFLEAYAALDRAGELGLHVAAAVEADPARGLEQVDEIARAVAASWSPHVRAVAAKIFADSVIETQTAALLDPYVGRGDDRGELLWSEERLREVALALDRLGVQLHIHAIGDRAIRVALDAIEYTRDVNGPRDRRPTLAHIQLFAPAEIGRFQQLGVAASFQPLWALPDEYIEERTLPFLGPERSRWLYPIASVARTGAVLASGSDWSVTSMNPLPAIETAITRRDPLDEPGPAWIPEETADLPTMLASYTIGAAWAAFREHDTGSLEAGKLADLIVLDRDLFAIPASEISDAKVLLTLFAGEVVYRDPELAADVLAVGRPLRASQPSEGADE